LTVRFSMSGGTDISVRAGQTGMSGPPEFPFLKLNDEFLKLAREIENGRK